MSVRAGDRVDAYELSRIISENAECEWYDNLRTLYVPALARVFTLTPDQWHRYADERAADRAAK